jgi:hypothetical protein
MRYLIVLALLTAMTAACSGDTAATTTGPPDATTPTGAVTAWVAAVEAGDVGRLTQLVEPVGMTLVAGIENNLDVAVLARLLAAGMPDDLLATYWTSFRDEFVTFAGSDLGELQIRAGTSSTGDALAAVDLVGDDGVTTVMVRIDGGLSRIDMVATLAPALAGRFGSYLAATLGSSEAPVVAEAYHVAVVPALEAIAEGAEPGAEIGFQLEYIRQLLAEIPAA